ncbi:MAG: hypothetical protein WCL39_06910, partial [Armatimonadota bacterium]
DQGTAHQLQQSKRVWFDALTQETETWDSQGIFKMARELQPGIVINNLLLLATTLLPLGTSAPAYAFIMPYGSKFRYA